MNLFAPDGRLLAAWSLWWFWVRTSICWLLLSLPVISAPAAMVWLIIEEQRRREGEAPRSFRESRELIRRWLFPAWSLAGIHLAAAGLVLIGLFGPAPAPYNWVVLLVSTVFAVTWLLLTPWSWVLLGRSGSARPALREAYRLSLRRLELAVASLVIVGGTLALLPLLPSVLLAFVVPALPAALTCAVTICCDRATSLTLHPSAGRTSVLPAPTFRRKALR